MYANRDHANRADSIRASDHAHYVARRNAWIVRALLAVAALLLAGLFIRAALPAPENATFSAVQIVDGQEYVIDYGMTGHDCAERIAALVNTHCEAE